MGMLSRNLPLFDDGCQLAATETSQLSILGKGVQPRLQKCELVVVPWHATEWHEAGAQEIGDHTSVPSPADDFAAVVEAKEAFDVVLRVSEVGIAPDRLFSDMTPAAARGPLTCIGIDGRLSHDCEDRVKGIACSGARAVARIATGSSAGAVGWI